MILSRAISQDHCILKFEREQRKKNSSCPICRREGAESVHVLEVVMFWLDTLEGEVSDAYMEAVFGKDIIIFDTDTEEVVYQNRLKH